MKQVAPQHSLPTMVVVGVLTGVTFGTALYKSQVYNPTIIQAQMVMENFTMLKTFVSALITGTIVFTALEALGLAKITSVSPVWNRNLVGGALLGAGIFLAGSCPGTVLAQLGAGLSQAPWIFLGGLVGAFALGLVSSHISKMDFFKDVPSRKPTLHEFLGLSRTAVAVPFVAVCIAFLYVLESYFPWQRDSGVSLSTSSLSTLSLTAPVWSPYIAGIIIGLVQLPNQYLLNHSLATSATFTSLVSTFLCSLHEFPSNSHFTQHKMEVKTVKNLWQPLVVSGVIASTFFWQSFSGNSPVESVTGALGGFSVGFLLVFGARFANGCTSGHGISGCAKLNLGSFIATAAMFGSGILVGMTSKLL